MQQRARCTAVFLPFALAAIAACSDSVSRWAGTMTDSAGVVIVSNTSVGMWLAGEEWTFEEELRIGVVEGDSNYQFGAISGVSVDSRNHIYVLDGMARHIKVFSPDGVYQRTIGRGGDGPGELRYGADLLMGQGDTLLVWDEVGRFVRFAPDGSSAGVFRMNLQEGVPRASRATPSGLIARRIRLRLAGVATAEDAFVLLASDGSVRDTLWTFPSDEFPTRGRYQIYAPRQTWDITVDTVVLLGDSEEYRIHLYADGRLERIVVRPFEQRMVTDRDKEAVNNALRAVFRSPERSPDLIEQLVERYDYSGFFPAFEAVFAGPRSTIWVQHVQAPSELGDQEFEAFDPRRDFAAPEWDVFDSEGRFLGVVTLPRRFAPSAFRGENIYGVWSDELGVEHVVRLRIVGDLSE